MPRRLSLVLALALALVAAAPAAAAGSRAVWSFFSAPDLHPPRLDVLVHRPGLARGFFLVGDVPNAAAAGPVQSQGGPELLDSHARPVWFTPSSGQAFDLQQESYRGRPVLEWFDGPVGVVRRSAAGQQRGYVNPGKIVIYDEHYRRVATIKAHRPWLMDLHDASISHGDIWVTVIRTVKHRNLTRYGGPREGSVEDVGLQEFQISTGRLIRTWDALNPGGRANVPLSASHDRASRAWDAYHLNSVQALPDGDLLISMRNTWAVYLIDPVRHRTLWSLGGKHSSFRIAHDARFTWQHDAQFVRPGQGGHGRNVELTMFDDNTGRGPAKGLILRLNTVKHTVSLVAAFPHRPPYYAEFLGSMQTLPGGRALVDWGSPYSYFTEFSKAGRELLNVTWPDHEQSYRTLFTDTWVGTPYYPPSGAVRGHTVYASWNGATLLSRWEVLAGSSAGSLHVVARHARVGFETTIKLSRSYPVYEVRALGSRGKILGTSKAFG
jgi:hypothetical protein